MEKEIQSALEVLRTGGTILYPTDTVWGIGCDATNTKAVEKVFAAKERPGAKSMIVLVDSEQMLNRYVNEVPAQAWDLIEASERPMTIVYDGVRGLAPALYADDRSAAIRLIKDPFCAKLIHKLGKPLVSTSANLSGEPAPAGFSSISNKIISNVDHVVNWRQEEQINSLPSSIVRLKNNGEVQVIRK